MQKEPKGVWIVCSRRLEPVYAILRNGKAHCTVCGELWPMDLQEELPASEPEPASEVPASAA